ncbi:unnamed protein product [Lactuca virosa]|uniref:Ribosomal protein L25 beta domain-containing protein n=1 Tax=Lactuca virosa TaxID=75947 RepID=A0AAU9PK70_9ASTR|nr:unnamed protein product [Lactuca virosa]
MSSNNHLLTLPTQMHFSVTFCHPYHLIDHNSIHQFTLKTKCLCSAVSLCRRRQRVYETSSSLSSSTPFPSFISSSYIIKLLNFGLAPKTPNVGFPKPDPKHAETIHALPRGLSGKNISAKERKAGRVPSIVFEQEDGQHGGNKRLISVQNNQIKKLVNHLGTSYFLSRLFDLEVRADVESDDVIEKVRVLPRLLHLHAATDAVLNVTFVRAPSHALLKVDVPLVFIGDDVSPGLKKGSYLNIIKRTAKFICPADIIPPFIEVDLSELDADCWCKGFFRTKEVQIITTIYFLKERRYGFWFEIFLQSQ